MSDWRQIQARIRKAKSAADPVVQLSALYERTRDAMVAFELARHHEKIGENQEAARWYTSAVERFRRAQWKVKAQEALIRLGAPIPSSSQIPESPPAEDSQPYATLYTQGDSPSPEHSTETSLPAAKLSPAPESSENAAETSSPTEADAALGKKRRRRGRRGGRGRRRGTSGKPPLTVATPGHPGEILDESRTESSSELEAPAQTLPTPTRPAVTSPRASVQARAFSSRSESRELIPDRNLESPSPQMRGRTGDPGLSSRMAHLESQLRRLLACPPVSLDQADQAPAGPGVFIVSDSDQITYYYVEACQTLRIGIANLLRADRAGAIRRGAGTGNSLREKFAEYLEINESKVSKYLKDHCSVRWIQLDEGARLLAHFAIAVLRPALND
ncbi:MAG TPA: hypothetical protein VOA41_13035 [Candidatus Dormibacteraeota bacterium]|nr:hypothetical protein [Candidatus Dormibacteraeota bacterium]